MQTELPIDVADEKVVLEQCTINGQDYFKIKNSHLMRPFFMSVVSDSNHWMFISSNGGLSAGRKDADHALFPYYTDDKITESSGITGSKTILRVNTDEGCVVWEPFSKRSINRFNIIRNTYKSRLGNSVLFEEVNTDLQLTFRYHWQSGDYFGFIHTSSLVNNSSKAVAIELIDGIQNVLPAGIGSDLQTRVSNLVDAYKRTELHRETGLGIFALSAKIVDRAEPCEALKANIAWSQGTAVNHYLLSSKQLNAFRRKGTVTTETDIKAEKGAYLLQLTKNLNPGETSSWDIIANVNIDHTGIVQLIDTIQSHKNLKQLIEEDIEAGNQKLLKLCASSDALQLTADTLRDSRHYSNVLFNIMRGGVFDENYSIEKSDFLSYLSKANTDLFKRLKQELSKLPQQFSIQSLNTKVKDLNDLDLQRLALEYLPLKFSRRHGDPSRPWNKFTINTRNEDGTKILDYEGNWRDIFQNWEALAHSFPRFTENMMLKFLNASTFDGYNPYRVTKDGFDWEVIEAHDPWSYIGYWGDHQIIYLLKFLEFIEKHQPGKLLQYFSQELFVYANVPYKIKPYDALLENPKDTIIFDETLDKKLKASKEKIGSDAYLLTQQDGQLCRANFMEKVLCTVLAKVSNFVPEAGIWMNTQRPEWNDANNALVGNGTSMVTLCYLRRFLKFFTEILDGFEDEGILVAEELAQFFNATKQGLETHKDLLKQGFNDQTRKGLLDNLGKAASVYREKIYQVSFSGNKTPVSISEFKDFALLMTTYADQSIASNLRADQLYHAYNLISIEDEAITISYLDEMLEGQVAVLSSGFLNATQSLQLLNALKASALFRHDQYSYILYPNKELSKFLEKNTIPTALVASSKLLQRLIEAEDKSLVVKDVKGDVHFNGSFTNAGDVKNQLDKLLDTEFQELVKKEKSIVLNIFEQVFDHKSFTGRSGTFFGYEGLGSIYWHMVSKLQLAVQEVCIKAAESKADAETFGKLLEHYYEINEGIGVHKSPELYGAFPTDPYSHTPATKGVQQPGMTGQVKEDILSRFGELGVFVNNESLVFMPELLRKDEFLQSPKKFDYITVNQKPKSIEVPENALAFTYVQVPIIYRLSTSAKIKVYKTDSSHEEFEGLVLNKKLSAAVFERTAEIEVIEVFVPQSICK